MTKNQTPLRLRVMAEYASSGIWVIEAVGPFRHGMIEHAALNLPASLAQGFKNWIELYYDNLGIDGASFNVESFNSEGLRLATELKVFLGADVSVEYIPEDESGSPGPAQEIELK